MKAAALACAIALVSTVCYAQQQVIAGDQLKQLVNGKTVDFGKDGSATYKTDGKYEFYNKANGSTFRGKWSVQGDRLCVGFDQGGQRCDQYFKDGATTMLKNSRGTTFPVTIK
jgi:hypothetical protein